MMVHAASKAAAKPDRATCAPNSPAPLNLASGSTSILLQPNDVHSTSAILHFYTSLSDTVACTQPHLFYSRAVSLYGKTSTLWPKMFRAQQNAFDDVVREFAPS
jgi:hypothetical protein